MPHYFRPFPTVSYDLQKNGNSAVLTDITLRFKIVSALKDAVVVYYDYTVGEGERPDIIAHKYYGDSTLDWLIFLANDIVDPHYDWPLAHDDLMNYIKKKYGSVSAAQSEVHHYEWIVKPHGVHFDGTIQPETVVQVDQTTYNSLSADDRREVTAFDYEIDLNDKKRSIKLIDKHFVQKILNTIDGVFDS